MNLIRIPRLLLPPVTPLQLRLAASLLRLRWLISARLVGQHGCVRGQQRRGGREEHQDERPQQQPGGNLDRSVRR